MMAKTPIKWRCVQYIVVVSNIVEGVCVSVGVLIGVVYLSSARLVLDSVVR
jgi:hypothetical protein